MLNAENSSRSKWLLVVWTGANGSELELIGEGAAAATGCQGSLDAPLTTLEGTGAHGSNSKIEITKWKHKWISLIHQKKYLAPVLTSTISN